VLALFSDSPDDQFRSRPLGRNTFLELLSGATHILAHKESATNEASRDPLPLPAAATPLTLRWRLTAAEAASRAKLLP